MVPAGVATRRRTAWHLRSLVSTWSLR